LDIQVVSNKEEFAALKDEWNELLSRSSTKHIFLTHEWQYTWWEHFGTRDEDLLILLVRDGGRLVGIAPLRRDVLRVRGVPLLKVITFLVGYEADYRDFLTQAGLEWDVLHQVFLHLRTNCDAWHLLSLTGIHGQSRTNEIVPIIARQGDMQHHGEMGAPCPFIPLSTNCDGFLSGMARSTRRNAQSSLRKMEREMGEVSLEIRQGCQTTAVDIDDFLGLHAVSWQDRGGSRALSEARVTLFHRDLMAKTRDAGWLLFSMLTVERVPCAVLYGYLYEGVFYDYLHGFSSAFNRYSPGTQIIMKTVEYGMQEGWREFDLLRGDGDYKLRLTRRVRHSMRHLVARSKRTARFVRLLEVVSR